MNPQKASREYLVARVETADPLERAAMLYQGAIRFTREAVASIGRKDVPRAHECFVKARDIVVHFLSSIPDADESDVAANLRGLLQYAHRKLLEGNLRKDPECAETALEVLSHLAEAWEQAVARRKETEAASRSARAASGPSGTSSQLA